MRDTANAAVRRRVATTLFWRGGTIAACAAVAVRWPAEGLLVAMLLVGVVAIVFGAEDIIIALRERHALPWWWALLTHGAGSVLFGMISISSFALSQQGMALVFAGWCLIAGMFALGAGLLAHARGAFGLAAIGIFVASVAANLYVLSSTTLTAMSLLYAGAAYATLLGLTEVGLGHWLRWRGARANLDL